tara:strand:+ start:610 stop:1059 length:450 start_codon:yes stop_codon:yes gene_type:complete
MKNLLYISPFLLFFSCSNEEVSSYDLSNNNNDINKLIVESFEVIDIRLQQIEGDLNKLEQKINDIDSDNSFEIDDYVYDYDKYIPPSIESIPEQNILRQSNSDTFNTGVDQLTDMVSMRAFLSELKNKNDQEYASDTSYNEAEENDDKD